MSDLQDSASVAELLSLGGARARLLPHPEPDSLVVLTLGEDSAWAEDREMVSGVCLRLAARLMCDPRQVIILTPGASLETVSGEALATLGLKRITP